MEKWLHRERFTTSLSLEKIFRLLLVCENEDSQAGVLFSHLLKYRRKKIMELHGPPIGVNKLGLTVQTNVFLIGDQEKSPFIA